MSLRVLLVAALIAAPLWTAFVLWLVKGMRAWRSWYLRVVLLGLFADELGIECVQVTR